jgi:AcrR family transcriptional regulator
MAMTNSEVSPSSPAVADVQWRRFEGDGLGPILNAALEAIVEVGFHGTTIRKIAERAGLSVPGVYHHYASKHALLESIMKTGMEDLWERTCLAVEEADGDIRGEFERYVECMVLFHASRPGLAAMALNEIRSLNDEAREAHIERRDRQHRLLEKIIHSGCEAGMFHTPYPRQATTAIITMCTSIAQWFKPDGELAPAELAVRYQTFALNIVE